MDMPSLRFSPRVPVIDANVCVGDHHTGPSPYRTRAQLFDEMDFHGIGRAVVYHAQTEEISPVDGNRFLEDWLDDGGRLIPQWSVLPTDDSLAQIQALHREGRVRCVRLHNAKAAGLPFRRWAYDTLLSWLGEAGVPLWIPLTEADPHEVVATLQAFPGLKTVLVGAHYSHALLVRPMLRAAPNAFLELSRYEPIGDIEALRDAFGAARLLYGSWYPRYAMGPMLFYLHHTRLSDEELAAVCAGNVERLLGLV
jgi:predicted TIM-barrel fold metal-dependent hydrolase